MVRRSSGRTYPQRSLAPHFGPAACGGACVQPTEAELQVLVDALQTHGCRQVVSVGCGAGVLEGLLQRPPFSLSVIAVDVDYLKLGARQQDGDGTYASIPCYADSIVRLPSTSSVFDVAAASGRQRGVCALFCYGKRLPWREYLDLFRQITLVAIIGDRELSGDESGCITQPGCLDLASDHEWSLVLDADITSSLGASGGLAVYARGPGPHPDENEEYIEDCMIDEI